MKKRLALLLSAMMAFALVACGEIAKADEFVRGSWEGNVYTNDSIGLAVTVPESWAVASDEDLAVMMGIAIEQSNSQMQISEEILKAQACYDMVAADPYGSSSILITAENMALTVGGTSYDEEAYADALANQLLMVDFTIGEESAVTIGKRDYHVLRTIDPENGMSQDYLITKIGSRMISVVLTYSPEENDLDSMLAMLGDA